VQRLERRTCDPEVTGSTIGRSMRLKANQILHPSGVDKLVPASAGGQSPPTTGVTVLASLATGGAVYR
jgi:hypothetical protein